jgi:hypothetical protein
VQHLCAVVVALGSHKHVAQTAGLRQLHVGDDGRNVQRNAPVFPFVKAVVALGAVVRLV